MSFKGSEDFNGKFSNMGSNHAAAIILAVCLAFLYLIRRGFRGLSVPGLGSVKVAT